MLCCGSCAAALDISFCTPAMAFDTPAMILPTALCATCRSPAALSLPILRAAALQCTRYWLVNTELAVLRTR